MSLDSSNEPRIQATRLSFLSGLSSLSLSRSPFSEIRSDLDFGEISRSLRPDCSIQIRRFPFHRLLPFRRRLFSSLRQSDPSLSLSLTSPSSSVPLLSCAAFRSVASFLLPSPSSSAALLSSMASISAASPLVDVSLFVDYSSQWGRSPSSPSSISARVLLDPVLPDQSTAASPITVFLEMQILSLLLGQTLI